MIWRIDSIFFSDQSINSFKKVDNGLGLDVNYT